MSGIEERYRVELRPKRRSKRFSRLRYPGFKFKRTGRRSIRWEGDVEESDLGLVRARAREDRYMMRAVPTRYVRSSDYRRAFVAAGPGPYRCRYCNRRLDADEMTVDHVVPVALAGRSKLARWVLARIGADGVNDLANLAAACARCNARKADKGGLWIVRGILGGHAAWWAALYAAGAAGLIALACVTWVVAQDPQAAGSALRGLGADIGHAFGALGI